MKSLPLHVIATVLLFPFFAGCGTSRDIGRITQQVTELRVERQNGAPVAVFTVRVNNETTNPVVIRDAIHRLSVNGRSVGRINYEQPTGIPALSVARQGVRIPVSEDIAGFLETSLAAGPVTYELDTTHYFMLRGEPQSMRVRGSGTIRP